MEYIVSGVPYIAQDADTTCWKAAYKMMLKYKGRDESAAERLPDSAAMTEKGIMDGQFLACRQALGLTSSTYKAFNSVDAIKTKLEMYGPIWVSGFYCNGHKHIVVLRGVKDPFIGEAQVYINDPWRAWKGGYSEPKWVSLKWFVEKLNPVQLACQHWL